MGLLKIKAGKGNEDITQTVRGNSKMLYISGDNHVYFEPKTKWENLSLEDAVMATLVEEVTELRKEVTDIRINSSIARDIAHHNIEKLEEKGEDVKTSDVLNILKNLLESI